jgi:hypothetical protein
LLFLPHVRWRRDAPRAHLPAPRRVSGRIGREAAGPLGPSRGLRRASSLRSAALRSIELLPSLAGIIAATRRLSCFIAEVVEANRPPRALVPIESVRSPGCLAERVWRS